jgi:GT2 family glycosyltransferase
LFPLRHHRGQKNIVVTNLKEDILYPNNMGCAKEYFSKIGYFDEREFLRYAEDNDWSYRALKLGTTISYVPEIAVTHQRLAR